MPNTIRYSVPVESTYYFNFYDNYFFSPKVGFVGFLGDPQPTFLVGQSIVVDQTSATPTNPSYDTSTTVTDIIYSNVYGDGLRWIVKTDINFGSNSPAEGGRISPANTPSVYDELSVKKGNFFIGVGDVPKGPSEDTGYWNGITPPVGGYIIYTGANGQPVANGAPNDAELIKLTNLIAGKTYSTVSECLIWFSTQPDKMVVSKDYEPIVTQGLVLNLDPGFIPSYPRSGINLYDISTYSYQTLTFAYNETSVYYYTKDIFYDAVLYNGPAFDSANGGSFIFDGTNDYCRIKNMNPTYHNTFSNFSFSFWFTPTTTISPGSLSTFSMMMEAQDTRLASGTPDTYVYFLTNGQLIFASYTPTQNLAATGTTWTAGTWYHLTCTYGSTFSTQNGTTGNKKIYINGVLNNSAYNVYLNYFNTFSQFGLGMYDGGASNGFKGKLTKYLVYLRVLSEDEVLQNYNATKNNFI
jgi:hypothetical protein